VNTDSNVTAQILLDGAREILGMELVQKVFQRIGHEDIPIDRGMRGVPVRLQVGPFFQALAEIYGEAGSRGLALRIGRAAFQYRLKKYCDQAGFRAMEFRLLPAPRRLESGLRSLAQIVERECGGKIQVSDEGAYWQWRVTRKATTQDCFLIAGLLQEFTYWAGGGRVYRVEETECQACGSLACTYRIEKRPLD